MRTITPFTPSNSLYSFKFPGCPERRGYMHELMPSAPAMVVATAITTLRMMLQMFFLFSISVVCL